ncbi:hypothetical protein CRE_03447 [Caenorhabditis remanei]|uniref:SAP domain-containing protein n=1 Tax=Caenorhabditis remanei TaxID=31234 RepID=E3NE37_CAERE|nr:hypothetical protein CRE_03447 [Caenorhabditis remanei]
MSAPFKPPEIARKSPTNLQNIPVDAAYRFSPLSEHFPVQHMPENDGKDVSSLSVSSLKAELEKRGLSSEGVKVVLIVRLTKAKIVLKTPIFPFKKTKSTQKALGQNTKSFRSSH